MTFETMEDEKMKTEFSDKRRTFLKMATLVGGAAAGLCIAKKSGARQEQPIQEQEKPGQGYRLTEHISKYYKTAKI
jgi:hypothetical protein